jgi:SAM-dependent methyltransferase
MTGVAPHKVLENCRSCDGGPFHVVHDFGMVPIADRLIDPEKEVDDLHAPLSLGLCPECGLAQIRETVEPRYLFHEDYPYYSSISKALTAHFQKSADALIEKLGLGPKNLVVEAASNDGYLLRHFRDAGIPALGIDPADGPVRTALMHGIETIHGFFGLDQARSLAASGKRADLFLANNVLAHVADTNDFVAGIAEVLSEDGVAVIEFPYLLDLVNHCAFDTIYHQHLLYLSLTAVAPIFERHGLYLNDVERLTIHGGSVRITVGRQIARTARLSALLALEAELRVTELVFFAPLLERMQDLRREFGLLLEGYRARGIKLVGYGAAAKATTLLHHLGLSRSDLSFIADKSPWKQGLEMPGTRIPIVAPEALYSTNAGAIVILAWNFANEIMAENADFAARNGEFVVPIPDLVITRGEYIRAAL